MSKPRLFDIPQFPQAHYEVNVGLFSVARFVEEQVRDYGLDIDPDYQREHVWTMAQRSAYLEYVLQGGEYGTTLVFNHCNWKTPRLGDSYTIVDGKQRLTTIQMFLRDEVPVFGHLRSEYAESNGLNMRWTIRWRILELSTRKDVLAYYLAMNTGGTPHSPDEIQRVLGLYAMECQKEQVRS